MLHVQSSRQLRVFRHLPSLLLELQTWLQVLWVLWANICTGPPTFSSVMDLGPSSFAKSVIMTIVDHISAQCPSRFMSHAISMTSHNDDLSICPMSAEVSMIASICPMSAEVSMMTSLSLPCQLRSQWWPLSLPCQLRSQWWPLYLSHVSWGLNDDLYLSHVSWGLSDDPSICPMSAEVSMMTSLSVPCQLRSLWWPLYMSHVSWGLNDDLYLSHVSWGLYDDLSISPMSTEVSMMTSLSVPCQQWYYHNCPCVLMFDITPWQIQDCLVVSPDGSSSLHNGHIILTDKPAVYEPRHSACEICRYIDTISMYDITRQLLWYAIDISW